MVRTLDFSPDNRFLASGQSRAKNIPPKIVLWDVKNQTALRSLKGHKKAINSLAWFPDGDRLISGDGGGTFIIWNAPEGRSLKQFTTGGT